MAKKKDTPDPKETETAVSEKEELVISLQRLQAEFENYRKRTELQLAEANRRAGNELIKTFLPVTDNLALAIEHADSSKEELLKGILMVQEQFLSTLKEQGVEKIPAQGKFNPELHEAMLTTTQEGVHAGEIIQVLQQGYTRDGKVLRPAKVSVAK